MASLLQKENVGANGFSLQLRANLELCDSENWVTQLAGFISSFAYSKVNTHLMLTIPYLKQYLIVC